MAATNREEDTMTATPNITKRSTMQEVIEAYPSAQRALFRHYHIGGCRSCGYEPGELLEEVAQRHGITDLDAVLEFVALAEQIDRRIQITPQEVAASLRSDRPPRLVDVRNSYEWETARIPGATLMTEALADALVHLPKDTFIVFYCHTGQRSLDAATYFAGHGFENVRSMTGGIDLWSRAVDGSVPRYEIARDLPPGMLRIRPLRAAVSRTLDCEA
jgi:rhodanese-related sulfurtransferase